MITAEGLSRTFTTKRGTVEAVAGVSLEVGPGEIVGFLGPNGAGKTTTLRMLTTLLEPTAGRASAAGCDLRTDPVGVRQRIGYVPQGGSTFPEARAGEEVVDQAPLFGLTQSEAVARRDRVFGQLELVGLAERPCKTLSGGQRRRLDITMGLVHSPVLVFLDEPTTGLDLQSRANLWEHIRGLRRDLGTTVFLTTHYLEEADALCDRILIIDQGRIVASGTAEELKQQVSGDAITLFFDSPAAVESALVAVRELDDVTDVTSEGAQVALRVPAGGRAVPALLRDLDRRGVTLENVEVHRPTLDDVFLTLTGRTLRDAA